ncbi:signal peptidase I SipW [Paenibacillus sacheonensis]|uniref:Signal peptidase I n=1 Tax=Paenibacillus sacheonensis TaxID=742054 RepID=A0A7X4YVC2_9BACL|nr:signal peptidase I [Paenibacillus sacheonensis]MBM7568005.1 signal peptidase [Paenibacillus sacheonensis]NBC73212.1 signal peptidase I [Paenibacillus sacheonensis]
MKLKSIMSKAATLLLIVVFLIVAFSVVVSKASGGAPKMLGYEIKIVLSGSMEPGIKTGSIVAIKPGGDMNRFKVGDVVTFKDMENRLITHRIVEVGTKDRQQLYTTKGDNNPTADVNRVPADRIVGQYSGFTIPYLGYGMDFANSKQGSLLLLVPGLLFLLYSIVTIWKAISDLEKKKAEPLTPQNPNPDTLA